MSAVLVVTFLAYAETLRYQFVFDDTEQILQNPMVQSWHNVPRFFTQHVWGDVFPNAPGDYYRPVFLLWLLINYSLFGQGPFGWHLTTVFAHIAVTLLVFLLARKILKDPISSGIASMIFGLHPVHIESVAWVSGVTDSLLAMLFIPAFLCYLNYRDPEQSRRSRWLWGSLVLYALALLAKETAIVLPLMIFAGESLLSPVGTSLRGGYRGGWLRVAGSRVLRAVLCIAPYVAITIVYLLVRIAVLKGFGHRMILLPFWTMALTWPSVLWFYIKLLVWPVGLSVFYDLSYVTKPGFSSFVMPLLLGVALPATVWWWLRRAADQTARPAILIAFLWLIMPILPVLNLSFFTEGEIAHDRYLYIPSIGFSILAGIALGRFRAGHKKLFGLPALQIIATAGVACALLYGVVSQHAYWSSELVLYHHGVTVAPNNKLAKANFGNAISQRGLYEEAISVFQEVYDVDPGYWQANYNLGYNYYKLGRFTEAEMYLVRAAEINPNEPKQYLTLAVTLFELGRLDQAERVIRHAIALRPHGYGFHYALGAILKVGGKLHEALDEFKIEVEYFPEYESAYEHIADIENQLRAKN
jgi:4-amino-4-deoxy-L-arabinose transferase-like glycosyltransferase